MPKVREAIRLVEAHGWRWLRTRGSHRRFVHAAVAMHLEGMREDGEPLPSPSTSAGTVSVAGR